MGLCFCDRWCGNNSNVTPKTVSERQTRRSLQSPVGDGKTLTLGCLHDDAELGFLTRLNSTEQDVALTRISKISLAQRTAVVDVEHVVTTNMADTAS